jgi:hypothetical protein
MFAITVRAKTFNNNLSFERGVVEASNRGFRGPAKKMAF